MKIYKAYNLYIASELSLPELIIDEGNPEVDVIVRFGKLDEVKRVNSKHECQFRGHVENFGDILISQGREIVIDPVPGADEGRMRAILLGPIFCVLMRQRGLLVLHASAVNINNKAVAFIGGPGWGKSTLATTFHTKGYDVLTDDVMPIQIGSGQPLVFPAYPQFKVWPQAVASLGHNAENFSPIFQDARKLAYKFSLGFQQTPLPLERIYVLDKGDSHKITKIQPQEAFVNLLRHTRVMSLVTEEEFLSAHMQLCSKLLKKVSFCRFIRKPSLDDLPLLVKMVEDDLGQIDIRNSVHESCFEGALSLECGV